MATPQKIIETAREYTGTPFMHQGQYKGVGIDCVHFIRNVARDSGATPDVEFEANYKRHEDGVMMLAMLKAYLKRVPDLARVQPADVVAFHDGKAEGIPRHIGIVTQTTPYLKVIHASERGVVEHRMDLNWKRRVQSVWRIRNLTEA